MTLREYIAHWQETYDKPRSRPTTYAAHDYIIKNHILPGLGYIHLSDLTESQIGAFLEERKRFGSHRPESPDYPGLSENTMRHIHRLLQQCLDQAIRDGQIETNPAKAFHYPKPKKVNANVLTPLGMEDYLDAAERLGYLPMFLLALTAGLRQGELIALKWSDLDTKRRTLTIAEKRAVERRELMEYGEETRTVTLTKEAVSLLAEEHTPSTPATPSCSGIRRRGNHTHRKWYEGCTRRSLPKRDLTTSGSRTCATPALSSPCKMAWAPKNWRRCWATPEPV